MAGEKSITFRSRLSRYTFGAAGDADESDSHRWSTTASHGGEPASADVRVKSKHHAGRRFIASTFCLIILSVVVSFFLMLIEQPIEDDSMKAVELQIADALFLVSDLFQIKVSDDEFPGGRIPQEVLQKRPFGAGCNNAILLEPSPDERSRKLEEQDEAPDDSIIYEQSMNHRLTMRLPSAEEIERCRNPDDPMSFELLCLPTPLRGTWQGVTISAAPDAGDIMRCSGRAYPKADMYLHYIREIELKRELLRPQWDFRGCLFFAATVLTTIGYGHQAPEAWASKMAIAVFALPAITLFGVSLAELSSLIIMHVRMCFSRIYRHYVGVRESLSPYVWTAAIARFAEQGGTEIKYDAVQDMLNDSEQGLGAYVEDADRVLIKSITKTISETQIGPEEIMSNSATQLVAAGSSEHPLLRSCNIKTDDLRKLVELAADRREAEAKATCARLDIAIGFLVTLVLLIAGALCFPSLEGWEYDNSFYFGVVTMTTIGLGDMYPETTYGLWFWYVWCALGLGSMSVVMNGMASLSQHSKTVRKAVTKSWDVADWSIQAMESAMLTSMRTLERSISRTITRSMSAGSHALSHGKQAAANTVGALSANGSQALSHGKQAAANTVGALSANGSQALSHGKQAAANTVGVLSANGCEALSHGKQAAANTVSVLSANTLGVIRSLSHNLDCSHSNTGQSPINGHHLPDIPPGPLDDASKSPSRECSTKPGDKNLCSL